MLSRLKEPFPTNSHTWVINYSLAKLLKEECFCSNFHWKKNKIKDKMKMLCVFWFNKVRDKIDEQTLDNPPWPHLSLMTRWPIQPFKGFFNHCQVLPEVRRCSKQHKLPPAFVSFVTQSHCLIMFFFCVTQWLKLMGQLHHLPQAPVIPIVVYWSGSRSHLHSYRCSHRSTPGWPRPCSSPCVFFLRQHH